MSDPNHITVNVYGPPGDRVYSREYAVNQGIASNVIDRNPPNVIVNEFTRKFST